METKLPLFIKKLRPEAYIPKKGSVLAAGYDLFASEKTFVPGNGKAAIKTALSIHVPGGTYGRIAPRSGLAAKKFIDTGAGVIDEDYRGEVFVLLFNHSPEDFPVEIGDRIAQLIIERIAPTEIIETDDLDATERGADGFGSTGFGEQMITSFPSNP